MDEQRQDIDPQLIFLLQILQVIYQSNNDPQVLYPLLQANLDKLDENFVNVLRNWACSTLSTIQIEQAQDIATVIGKLSKSIRQIYSSNRVINLEIEITGYEVIIPVFNRQNFPQLWADIHNNLGAAYSERIKGERAENLEISIDYYLAALEIYTREASPEFWATTQINLGFAYLERIKGERAENLDAVIRCFEAALEVYHRQAFPQQWANIQSNLCLVYLEHIYGEKAENLEKAIQYCLAALEVYTRDLFPLDWAGVINNLGLAYNDRIRGEKAENLEKAIQCYLSALEVRTRETFPEEWADTQINLGTAYLERIHGQKVENIEAAIHCFELASKIHTQKTFPERWADNQSNLGYAYRDRIQGKRVENLEMAIHHFVAALEVRTQKTFPQKWADVQNNLGIAYRERIQGEQAENLEAAICCFKAALEVHTQKNFPQKWADIQNNLGNAYRERIQGKQAENLKAAIYCFNATLDVYTAQAFPQAWADIQTNLGIAYSQLFQEQSIENMESAIYCFNAALDVYTAQAFPQAWADIQNNLGNVYFYRIQGEKSENLERAIEYYLTALKVRTREAFPQAWADIQNNLGNVYFYRIQGEKSENLERAIEYYLTALEVRTCEAFPSEHVKTKFCLGLAYQKGKKLRSAHDAFSIAIQTVESQREEIVFGSGREENKQKLAEEWNELYQRMVKVCLELNNVTEAIEYVESSKTRNLVELILTKDRHTIFPPEVVFQLDRLRDEIASGQYELQNATAEDPTALTQHLQKLRQQRNELQDQYLPMGSGFQFEPFRSKVGDRTAIVEFYITTDKLLVFIITKQTQKPIILSPDLVDLKKLETWSSSYLRAYNSNKNHWQRRLTTRLNLLTKILHFDEIIEQIPPLCDQLTLIPHRFLHLLPLHALPLVGNSSLFERFPGGVSYAPSCQLLQLAQNRKRPEFTHLFAVQNPSNSGQPLSYADVEVEAIQNYFDTSNVFKQKIATKEAIDETSLNTLHCAHFSCHGYFNTSHPRQSALILANAQLNSASTQPDTENYLSLENGGILNLNKCLTLDNIFTLSLDKCRLVTLSACETGLIDFRNTSDEYIGLPSGFLYAGAAIVVSSLWTVNDLSTAFLMIKFYQNLKDGLAGALALNQAQLWLRDLTKGDLERWIEENSLPLEPAVRMSLRRHLHKLEDGAKPFESPLHWGAFCATGQ